MKKLLAIFFLVSCAASGAEKSGVEFFVATNGDDANPGTAEKPFATFQRAQQAVRKTPRGEKKVTVRVRGGEYVLRDPLIFTSEDSGDGGADIFWEAADDESPVLSGSAKTLIEFRGDEDHPPKFIRLVGFIFRQKAGAAEKNEKSKLENDIFAERNGAIFFNGAEDCAIENCFIDQPAGNAVCMSNYNRRNVVRGCDIFGAGASGIVFIGDPNAMREPRTEEPRDFADLSREIGPRTTNYPGDCIVEDCLIHDIGRAQKNSAGIAIELAMSVNVRHCSIYETSGAGIFIGSGCWGGHIIELCDVFETSKKIPCGAFQSFGRDRWWNARGADFNTITLGKEKDFVRLDAFRPVALRTNRWRCDEYADIVLGEGATHYEISHNLCLHGGIEMRAGFYRVVEGNVIVNNSLRVREWFENSWDVFRANILFSPYAAEKMPKRWGKKFDNNLLHVFGKENTEPTKILQEQSGRDEHSIVADALFNDAANGDYTVHVDSPALPLGFWNFPMDQFGVVQPELKKIARTPKLP